MQSDATSIPGNSNQSYSPDPALNAVPLDPTKPENTKIIDLEVVKSAAPTFLDLGLPTELCKLVQDLGYEVPTPIQMQAIPVVLGGKDLIAQAQTGTGKTAAFALPLLSKLKFDVSDTQVLVLTPTRELAIQVAEAFMAYARIWKSFHVLPIYGGQSIGIQLRQLERKPQVIVGTPGRVMDHLRRKSLDLSSITSLVLDEADEMLSMGFLEDIEWILTHTPSEKQTALFSATMPREVKRVAQAYLKDPQEILIKKSNAEQRLTDQSVLFVDYSHKLDALSRILEVGDADGMIVFVRTKNTTMELAEKLEARGHSVGALNGDMTQEARERTVERLKQGKLDILVATDVAARGLDVDRISHVINFDIPFDAETYTHRIGRTGRAGRSGKAILFVNSRERGLLRTIERQTGIRLPEFAMPTREDINKLRNERFKAKVVAELENPAITRFSSLITEIAAENDTTEGHIAAALCSLLQVEGAGKSQKTSGKKKTSEKLIGHTGSREENKPQSPYKPRMRTEDLYERSARPKREGKWESRGKPDGKPSGKTSGKPNNRYSASPKDGKPKADRWKKKDKKQSRV